MNTIGAVGNIDTVGIVGAIHSVVSIGAVQMIPFRKGVSAGAIDCHTGWKGKVK